MWSAPAERNGDGALAFEPLRVALGNPKRCRATLATALQSLDTMACFWLNARTSPRNAWIQKKLSLIHELRTLADEHTD